MQIKDVVNFYIGCEIEVTGFKNIVYTDVLNFYFESGEVWGDQSEGVDISNVKLVLRSMKYIRTYEVEQYELYCKRKNGFLLDTPESFAYLIKRRFDLYGLITKGQAKLKQNQQSSVSCLEGWLGRNNSEAALIEKQVGDKGRVIYKNGLAKQGIKIMASPINNIR